jgi:uncharacterized surface protein with fasciclin (FAS1) repeats
MNMKLHKKILVLALLCFMGSFMITGCEKDDKDAVPTDTIDTLLSTTGNLTIFKAALELTGLETFAKGPGPFTFFAPNDDAFKATGINSPADLAAVDLTALTQVLAFHIINGNRTFVEIPQGPNAPIATINGLSFYASRNSSGAYLNGSKIVTQDIKASNGIIHVVNKIMVPPITNVLGALAANPNFKLFNQAIGKAAATANFTASPITVFAPTNAAMIAGGYDSTAIANSTGTTLLNILRYHIVPARMFSSEFAAQQYKTVQGSNVAISFSNGAKIKGIANATPANITSTDFAVSNGVVHTIDALLKY